MQRLGSTVVSVAVAALLAACPGGGNGGRQRDDTLPGGFTPGPPLEDPLPADPSAFGYEFMAGVAPALQERWRGFLEDCRLRLPPDHALNDPSLVTTVDIAVDSRGKLESAELGDRSGNAEFDAVALEVARDVTEYPTPAPEILSDDGLVHVTWSFARDRRQAGVATASIERIEFPPERAVPLLLGEGRFAEAARRAARAGDGGVALADQIAEAAIAAALESGEVTAQQAAVEAARAARLTAAGPALRGLATGAADLELRKAAVVALGAVGDADAVALLAEVLQDGAEEGQLGAAAAALHALGATDRAWELLAVGLDSDDDTERWKALVALAHFPAGDAVPKLSALLTGPGPRGQRLAAAAALGAAVAAAGHKAAKPLVAGLEERDAAVRAACVQALADAASGGYANKVAFWGAVKLLADRDERVRAAAVLAAARLGGARFAKELRRLRKERAPAVLAALAEGLGGVPGEAALDRLLALADHEDAAVRRAAARALSRRDEEAAVRKLAAWVDDGDAEVRLVAIAAATDEGVLRGLLEADDAAVQAAALRRLAATAGRPEALGDALELLADAPTAAHRAAIAGGWLAAR